MITAILLAAGASRRFGAPKLLQDLEGKPVLRWSAEAFLRPPVDEVIVVVPPEHDEFARILAGTTARLVANPHPERGMGTSLACAIAALRPATEAVLVGLADEPVPDRAAIGRVVVRYRERGVRGVSIVVPTFGGVRGHPVLFGRSAFAELETLTGDRGAREVTDRDPSRVAIVELDTPKPIDVDTPADLALVRKRIEKSRTLLDRLMPVYHERASYGTIVHASSDIVYRAVLETNLADSVVAKTLMALRSLGRRRYGSFRFRDLPDRGTFFRLADDPPREVVAGVIGQFWKLRGNVKDGDSESFHAPLPPGTAKAVWNFRVEELSDWSRLTTETRVLCADDDSRRQFHRYWTIIGPFSGLIRREALRLIRRTAHFMSSSNTISP